MITISFEEAVIQRRSEIKHDDGRRILEREAFYENRSCGLTLSDLVSRVGASRRDNLIAPFSLDKNYYETIKNNITMKSLRYSSEFAITLITK